MQFLWYLPSVLIGLSVGLSSGQWQMALISLLMVAVMGAIHIARNRYPQFDSGDLIHLSHGQVAIGNRVLPRYEIFWKKQWHELLFAHFEKRSAPDFLADLLASKQNGLLETATSKLSLWLGAANNKELILDLATDGPHLIVVGPTGSGKSELLKLMLRSLTENQEIQLVLFDFKGGATLQGFKSKAVGMATDLEVSEQERLWSFITSELSKRERLFAEAGVASLQQFNSVEGKMSEIVVVIDEFAAVLASSSKAHSCIEDVCARGRSLGIHLICATQSLTGIPRSMLTNLRARVAMAGSDPIDFVQLGINANKLSVATVSGWGSAYLSAANRATEGFNFPFGFTPTPKPAASTGVDEPVQPARSQFLRQMYSSPEPAKDLPEAPSSNPTSQLLSRMEGLRW